MTDADDDYEGSDDLAERLGGIDDAAADRRAEALRAGLEDYALDEEDRLLLEGGELGDLEAGGGAGLLAPLVGGVRTERGVEPNRISPPF